VRFASDAQAWALKPAAFGGGSGAFTGLTWQDLGYEISGTTYNNLNGTWAAPSIISGTEVLFAGQNTQANNEVEIRVCGMRSQDIRTSVGSIGEASAPAC
jgi:hypothetical protein